MRDGTIRWVANLASVTQNQLDQWRLRSDGVRRRFYTLVDAAGFDEDRARAWVIVRVVNQATCDPANLTRYIALAKAVQDCAIAINGIGPSNRQAYCQHRC